MPGVPNARTLGAQITELRRGRGLTQSELAAALDLPSSLVSRIEADQRGIGAGEALEFAAFFNVSADTLLGPSFATDALPRVKGESEEIRAALDAFERDVENLLSLRAATEPARAPLEHVWDQQDAAVPNVAALRAGGQ